jgi:hypothetical protein
VVVATGATGATTLGVLGFLAAGFFVADLALGALDLLAGLLEGDLVAFLAILIIIPKWILRFHL